MIHISAVIEQMDLGEKFSLKFIKKSTGEIVYIEEAECISSFHMGTRNIRIIKSQEIRKIIDVSIIEFNKKEVYL